MERKRVRQLVVLPLLGIAAAAALVMQVRGSDAAEPAVNVEAPRLVSTTVRAEGRVVTYPGGQVTLSTEREGLLSKLNVDEKSMVRKGDVIAEFDSEEQRAALQEARAQVREAEALLRQARTDARRYAQLHEQAVVSPQQAESARRDADTALAKHSAALARVEKLRAQLEKSRILSPIDGVVISRAAQPGEVLKIGSPLVTIADLTRSRIEAEVDEFDIGHVSLGAPVTIQAEGFTDMRWQGHVEEIPDAVSSRRLKPQDPGRPQDTRVLLVKVAMDEPTPLKLGQRIEVDIDASKGVAVTKATPPTPSR